MLTKYEVEEEEGNAEDVKGTPTKIVIDRPGLRWVGPVDFAYETATPITTQMYGYVPEPITDTHGIILDDIPF